MWANTIVSLKLITGIFVYLFTLSATVGFYLQIDYRVYGIVFTYDFHIIHIMNPALGRKKSMSNINQRYINAHCNCKRWYSFKCTWLQGLGNFSTARVLLAGNYFSQHWLYSNVTMAVPGNFCPCICHNQCSIRFLLKFHAILISPWLLFWHFWLQEKGLSIFL